MQVIRCVFGLWCIRIKEVRINEDSGGLGGTMAGSKFPMKTLISRALWCMDKRKYDTLNWQDVLQKTVNLKNKL